jgi:hypothetical protein
MFQSPIIKLYSRVFRNYEAAQHFIPAAVFYLKVPSDAWLKVTRKEEVVICSKVLQYHVSHLSTDANVFAKPFLLVRIATGSSERRNEPSRSMKSEETS